MWGGGGRHILQFWGTKTKVYFMDSQEIRLKKGGDHTWTWPPSFDLCKPVRCQLTSQQVRWQVSRQGPYEQPVAVGWQLTLVDTIRSVEALIEYVRAWPAAARYAEAGVGWPTAREPDPGSIGPVGVSEPRDPLAAAGVARREIGAGISPSSAVEHRAALFTPHASLGVASSAFVRTWEFCFSLFSPPSLSLCLAATHGCKESSRSDTNKGGRARHAYNNKGEELKVSSCVRCVKCVFTDGVT